MLHYDGQAMTRPRKSTSSAASRYLRWARRRSSILYPVMDMQSNAGQREHWIRCCAYTGFDVQNSDGQRKRDARRGIEGERSVYARHGVLLSRARSGGEGYVKVAAKKKGKLKTKESA